MKFTDCIDITGKSCKKFGGKKLYISTGAVDVDHVDSHQIEMVNYDTKPSRANLITDDKSILFAKMQGTKKVLLINKELENNLYSTGFFSVSPKKNILNKKCLYHLLGSKTFLSQKDKYCSGATQKAISLEGLNKIEITIPNLEEQYQIAKTLDSINAIIKSYEKELKKYDELIKARFIEMFGDPENNPNGWMESPLSEKLNVLGGFAFKSDKFSEISGIPILRIGNINSGYFKPVNMVYWKEDENLDRYLIYPGDLVMSLTGTVGKDDYGNVCILGNDFEKYYLNQRNAKLEIQGGINKFYLSQLLKFKQVKKKLTGINRGVRQANISNKDILNLVVPIPPIELQQQFEDFVRQVDKSKLAVQKSLEKTQQLFDSLMQEYFG